ncbi:MAG: hypothetical protein ACK5PP_11480 [Acidimicrobiales bacterium]
MTPSTTTTAPDAGERRRENRRRARHLLGRPESLGAMTLVVIVVGVPGVVLSWIVIPLLVLFLLLHSGTVAGGNHLLLWMTTALVFVYALFVLPLSIGGGPIVFAAVGLVAFAYNELTRLAFLRRRGAVVDPAVFLRSLVGLGAVAGCTLAGSLALQAADSSSQTLPWGFWMIGLLGVLVIALALLVMPLRRGANRPVPNTPHRPGRPAPRRRRWTPGDRIPPQPLGRDEPI